MKYHSLHFRSHGTALVAKGTLEDSRLPLKELAIFDTPYTVNFKTDDDLDEASQALILEKTKPHDSKFNEEPPYSQQAAIEEYTRATQNLSVSSTETFKLSVKNSEIMERLEAEALRHGLKFKFDEEDQVWTLAPLKVGFDEEIEDDEDDDEFDQGREDDEEAERSND